MALTNFGLTPYGFSRPTLLEIVEDVKSDFQTKFGAALLTTDDSVAGQLAAIMGEREDALWRILEAVYASHTLTGAEGVYLNDVLAKNGLFRRDAQAGSGMIYVITDKTCPNMEYILKGTQYKGKNGKTYMASKDIFISSALGGFEITAPDVVPGLVQFFMDDPITGKTSKFEFIVQALPDAPTADPSSVALLFQSLRGFLSTMGGGLYSGSVIASDTYVKFGFDTTGVFKGVPIATAGYFTTPLGKKYTEINVVCTETGYNILGVNGVTSMTPQPAGYVGVVNPLAFYSGSEVETDAEYRLRHSITPSVTGSGTPRYMVEALSRIEGVEDVRLYENPTPSDAFSPAAPFTAMFVVLGGDAMTIVNTLYGTKPVNVNLSGSFTQQVTTADGRYDDIKYTPAREAGITVAVSYSTKNNVPLNNTEKESIIGAIQASIRSAQIGDTLYVSQLISAALGSVSITRIKTLTLQIKKSEQADTYYTPTSLALDYDQSAYTISENIIFQQTV